MSEDGAAYTYEVDEEPVEGYNKEVDGYDLINTNHRNHKCIRNQDLESARGTNLPESITVIPET